MTQWVDAGLIGLLENNMVDIEKLKKMLEKNIVEITFESLKSGKTHSREYTLSQDYLPLPNHISRQSGDRLIVWDVEFQKWEDILLTTIIDWKLMQAIAHNPYEQVTENGNWTKENN